MSFCLYGSIYAGHVFAETLPGFFITVGSVRAACRRFGLFLYSVAILCPAL